MTVELASSRVPETQISWPATTGEMYRVYLERVKRAEGIFWQRTA